MREIKLKWFGLVIRREESKNSKSTYENELQRKKRTKKDIVGYNSAIGGLLCALDIWKIEIIVEF